MERQAQILLVAAALAGGAFGCSDPVPAPAKGGVYFDISGCSDYTAKAGKEVSRTTECVAGMKTTEVGLDGPHPFQVPFCEPCQPCGSQPWAGTRLKDGEAGARVSCQVSGAAPGPFSISGRISARGETLQGNRESIALDLSAGSLTEDAAGTARITITEPGGAYTSTADCTLSAAGPILQVAPGVVFASFTCPSMSKPPSNNCSSTGLIVFENCSK